MGMFQDTQGNFKYINNNQLTAKYEGVNKTIYNDRLMKQVYNQPYRKKSKINVRFNQSIC